MAPIASTTRSAPTSYVQSSTWTNALYTPGGAGYKNCTRLGSTSLELYGNEVGGTLSEPPTNSVSSSGVGATGTNIGVTVIAWSVSWMRLNSTPWAGMPC